ncbi:MAG: cold shock domain-containing protein [Cyclobacteriaceae bacterium]|nr:cold shock domain-containing protein [Cyclobacteriaceae bacterium]
MAKSSNTFNKRELEKKKLQQRKEKEQRKEERKNASKEGKPLEEMFAYVDENGNLTTTPPDVTKKFVAKESDIELTSRNRGGSEPEVRRKGVVKFFDTSKGFGFIKDGKSGEEFFFHQNSVNFSIAQSDQVTFDVEMGHKGMQAAKIQKA